MGQDMSNTRFRGGYMGGATQTTVHVHHGAPAQQTTTVQGQVVHGMPVQGMVGQPGVATTIVNTPAQSFNIGHRRKTATISCCGHTLSWTLLVLGLVLFIVGTVMTAVFAEDIRTPRIKAYNKYVEDWRMFMGDAKYVTPKFNVYSELKCRGNNANDIRVKEYNLRLDLITNATDQLDDTKATGAKPLPLEPQHKYRMKTVFTQADVGGHLSADKCSIYTNVTEGNPGTPEETKIVSFSSPLGEWRQFSCKDDKEKCDGKCKYKHEGHYDYRTGICTYPMVMDQICVKVKTEAHQGRSVFVADETFPVVDRPEGSSGCYYSREKKMFRHRHFYNDNKKWEHSDMPITYYIRYSQDAWLGYMRVTGNSGYFGRDNGPLLSIGISFIVTGVVLSAAFVYVFFFVIYRQVRRINMAQDNEHAQGNCFVVVW